MLKFVQDIRKVPVLRVLLPYLSGIILFIVLPENTMSCNGVILISVLGMFFLCFAFIYKRYRISDYLFGISLVLTLLCFGYLSICFPSNESKDELENAEAMLIGNIIEGAVEGEGVLKLKISAKQCYIDSIVHFLDENIQVYIHDKEANAVFAPGDTWVFYGKLTRIRNHGNPGEFDYQGYMNRRDYRYNLFVTSFQNVNFVNHSNSIKYTPAKVKQKLSASWDLGRKDFAVLSAITLGDKSLLDRDIKRAYSDAGAMHLLAVSGLHVGMIWWILDLLIWIPKKYKSYQIIKLFLILFVLWFYAGITGFSNSVTRSVTMFSLLAVAKALQRNTTIYNTLLLSCLILLVVKPNRILDAGFQLSYFAVIGIVSLHPLISKCYENFSKPLKRILDMLSVSIAAQFATLPLVIFYFHQFPVFFLLTNIYALPLVSIILPLFVIFSPFLIFFPDYNLFTTILLKLIHLLNVGIERISSLPNGVISGIAIHPLIVIGLVFFSVSIILFLYYKRIIFLLYSLLIINITIAISGIYNLNNYHYEALEVYNFKNETIVSAYRKYARNSFIIEEDNSSLPYVDEYLELLEMIPGKVKMHLITKMNQDENQNANWVKIADGIFGIKLNTQKLLVIGDCSELSLHQSLLQYDWDALLFRRGYCLSTRHLSLIDKDAKVLADGSLRFFEIEKLLRYLPQTYVLSQRGYYKFNPR